MHSPRAGLPDSSLYQSWPSACLSTRAAVDIHARSPLPQQIGSGTRTLLLAKHWPPGHRLLDRQSQRMAFVHLTGLSRSCSKRKPPACSDAHQWAACCARRPNLRWPPWMRACPILLGGQKLQASDWTMQLTVLVTAGMNTEEKADFQPKACALAAKYFGKPTRRRTRRTGGRPHRLGPEGKAQATRAKAAPLA